MKDEGETTQRTLDAATEGRLRALFAKADRVSGGIGELREPHRVSLFSSGEGVLFRGEALRMLHDLETQLAGPSASGGPSLDSVGVWVETATWYAFTENEERAIEWLRERLSLPSKEWLVLTTFPVHISGASVRVGKCEIHSELPAEVKRQADEHGAANRFPGRVILTRVPALDERSARLQASERFAEVRAIFVLFDSRKRTDQLQPFLSGPVGDVISLTLAGADVIIATYGMYPAGGLGPSLEALSRVAEKEEPERNDWERRTLSALRWFANTTETQWISEVLVGCIVALETLFLSGEPHKGRTLAHRVTEIARVPGISREEQIRWLGDLYKRRNDAVHEGRGFLNDLEVERLTDLVSYLLRWAVQHLLPEHRNSGRACRNLHEVLAHRGQD